MKAAKCATCGVQVVPQEIAHDIHGAQWTEPSRGWAHNPSELDHNPDYSHIAHPHDNRSLEQEHQSNKDAIASWDNAAMDQQVKHIMKNVNLSPRQFE
jgi:hypothetical protein